MKPLLLKIQKRFIVQNEYSDYGFETKSNFVKVGEIPYDESINFFNKIRNDAQLALYLLRYFGESEYNIICWQKGTKGFWTFIKLKILPDYFIRLEKKKDMSAVDIKDRLRTIRRLKDEADNKNNLEESNRLFAQQCELEDLQTYYNMEDYNRGVSGIIEIVSKPSIPCAYQEYGLINNNQQTYENPFYSSSYEETDYQEQQEPKNEDDKFRIW